MNSYEALNLYNCICLSRCHRITCSACLSWRYKDTHADLSSYNEDQASRMPYCTCVSARTWADFQTFLVLLKFVRPSLFYNKPFLTRYQLIITVPKEQLTIATRKLTTWMHKMFDVIRCTYQYDIRIGSSCDNEQQCHDPHFTSGHPVHAGVHEPRSPTWPILVQPPPALVGFFPQAQLHEVIHSIEPGRPPSSSWPHANHFLIASAASFKWVIIRHAVQQMWTYGQ